MSGLKSQSCLFTSLGYTHRHSRMHTHLHTSLPLCHLAVNKAWHVLHWHLEESTVWPLFPVLSLSQWVGLTLWQWIKDDKFGLLCPSLLLSGPVFVWRGPPVQGHPDVNVFERNTVATHELDSCIVLKDCRCWLSDLSQSILEFPRPHWIMEIINPSGPVEEEKESWGQCFFYLDDLLLHSQVLMFCLLFFCCCWWMGKC